MRFAQPIEDAVVDLSYPSSTDVLVAEHGDLSVPHPNGSVTVAELLAHLPDERIESVDEARLLVWGAFDEAAIGRKAYSDRDPPRITEFTYEPVSF